MLVYITLTAVTVVIALFVRSHNHMQMYGGQTVCRQPLSRQVMCSRVAAFAVFLLLFAVSACRIAVGNDYWGYREIFQFIYDGREVSTELGFNLVVRLVQCVFGRENYLVIFGLFSFLTAAFMVKALYDQSENFSFSLFLFMTSGYYFSSLNSIRYYFAMAVAMFALKYVIRGDYTRFILWIIFAAFFHKSVLIVIPLYLLAKHHWKRWQGIFIGLLCASFLLVPELYRRIIFFFYPFYENSMFDRGDYSVTNLARCLAVLALALLFYKRGVRGHECNRVYFNLNIGALILYALCSFIPEASRIGYYMNVTNVFLIPSLIRCIPGKWMKRLVTAGVIAAFTGYFALYLRSAYDVSVRILPYLNWIFN